MRRRCAYGLALLAACAAAISFVGSAPAAEEELDPLEVAGATHKLVLENAFVRVIEAKVLPWKVEAKHRHPQGLTVYLASYSIEQKTFPDGKVTRHDRKLGSHG